ncbi:MAG: HEPN domain-containing protein [Deltaproteobacteria bacterium]|nr:HEPN domain-containing protein [Deltaproteobacteria bacterium]
MSEEEAKRTSIQHWWKMAEEALQSAKMEYEADLFHGAINRAYYAVFYAATALFVKRGLSFRKHAGVRSAVHRELVKKEILSVELGMLYDRLFEDRQHGDYMVLTEFEPDEVKEKVESASAFLKAI